MTKNISKTPAPSREAILARTRQASRGLRDPKSYEGIAPQPPPPLPASLLLFCRQHAETLSGSRYPAERSAAHQHHRHVLICSLEGRGRVWIDSESFTLEPGQAILICPYQKHGYADIEPSRVAWLFVTFEHPAHAILDKLRSRPAVALDDQALQSLNSLLVTWMRNNRDPAAILHAATLLHVLAKAAPLHRRPKRDRESPTNALLGEINRLAFQHRNRAISIKEIAARVGISPGHLRTTFRAVTGQSLGAHLRDFRLQYACYLLREDTRRIGEIAEACGYESQFTFSRAFKRAYGCSPRAYRTNLLAPSPKNRLILSKNRNVLVK